MGGACCRMRVICVRSLSTRPEFSLLKNPSHFHPDIVLTAGEPVKLHLFLLLLLLLLPIFPDATRGFGEIRIPRYHYLIKSVGLNRKILTRLGDVIVWDGDDGGDRIFSARDGVTSKDVMVGIVEGVATLAQERQPEDAMVDVEFQSTSISAD